MRGLFVPKRPHPFAAWEAIEWYARGFTAKESGQKVGVCRPTVMTWMRRIGVARRPAGLSLNMRLARRNRAVHGGPTGPTRP